MNSVCRRAAATGDPSWLPPPPGLRCTAGGSACLPCGGAAHSGVQPGGLPPPGASKGSKLQEPERDGEPHRREGHEMGGAHAVPAAAGVAARTSSGGGLTAGCHSCCCCLGGGGPAGMRCEVAQRVRRADQQGLEWSWVVPQERAGDRRRQDGC